MATAARRPHGDRGLFDLSPQPMWAVDEQTLRFLDVNAAALALYGYARGEFLRMSMPDVRLAETSPRTDDGRWPDARPATWIHRRKDGSTIEVEAIGSRIDLDGRAARLIALRALSAPAGAEPLQQPRQMQMVGQLAAGIAHDFNNLLAAIIGHTDLLSEYLVPTDPRADEVAGIRRAAEDAARLIRQLLDFGRTQPGPPREVDVNEVIDKVRPALARMLGGGAELIVNPAAALWRVHGDARQLERVVLSLAVNAREAMPAGGRITLTTRNVRLDDAVARSRSVAPGEYVELSVADTGVGMGERTRQRLFEPFFTTKARGRGTGLGLAAVHGIVQRSGGHITVASESGAGACFAIYLPSAPDTPRVVTPTAEARDGAAAAVRGRETVLVVEDDAAVRSLIAHVLERRGYQLMVAGSGDEALRLAGNHPSPIDLLITDIVMTRMTGIEVADAVRAQRPDTKVLFVSGCADEMMLDASVLPSPGFFLSKPFTPDTLARKIRSILDVQ